MTIFLLDESPGVWLDMDGGGRVQLRTITADDLKEIRKQTVKKRVEYKRVEGKAERFEVEEIDNDLQSELFWDHVIVAWENFFDRKRVPIPCTKENKILLLSRSTRFITFVNESLTSLAADERKQAEQAEKN